MPIALEILHNIQKTNSFSKIRKKYEFLIVTMDYYEIIIFCLFCNKGVKIIFTQNRFWPSAAKLNTKNVDVQHVGTPYKLWFTAIFYSALRSGCSKNYGLETFDDVINTTKKIKKISFIKFRSWAFISIQNHQNPSTIVIYRNFRSENTVKELWSVHLFVHELF